MDFFVACMHVSASSADEEAEVASMQTTYNGIHMQDDYLYIYFALLSTNMHDNPDTKTDKQPWTAKFASGFNSAMVHGSLPLEAGAC